MTRLRRAVRARRVVIRPMTGADGRALDAVVAGLSPAGRRARYLDDVETLSPRARAALLAIDGTRHVAFLAEVRQGRALRPIGIARYVTDGAGHAEIAYEVVDDWQGCGVGSSLLRRLVDAARRAGIDRLDATLLGDNVASMGLLRTVLPTVRVRRAGKMLEVSADLTATWSTTDVVLDLATA